ncbi:hypothetical protein V0288_16975 [Pannus brasiliensis CCIBt3594]|uniref:Signal peptidase I n=1 Tax=Pannus brasiliensis CCIBt3594 TaxID=1427578 RepID=A0AAW9QP18_9CHRO
MDIEFANAGTLDTNGTGWLIGFGDWTKAIETGGTALRCMPENALARNLQVKWMIHPAGDDRGTRKPISVGRSISILASESGRFRLEFSPDANFPEGRTECYTLEKHGDLVIWGENIYHRWFVEAACTIITIRWTPVESVDA